jgi:deoxycytidylate deaminase
MNSNIKLIHHNILNAALDIYRQFPFSLLMRQHYIAIIVDNKNNIISVGFNTIRYRSSKHSSKNSLHAEIDAINRCQRKLLNNATMFVTHVNHNPDIPFTFVSAKPCHDCAIKLAKCMKNYGLRYVFYTTNMNL